jgi:amidase
VLARFDHCDVLVMPTVGAHSLPVEVWRGKSGLSTLLGMSKAYPFCAPWNHLGNPACSVPMGFTDEGWPLSVQLVGRPNDETTLLSLAAQIEAERPWAGKRPPVS